MSLAKTPLMAAQAPEAAARGIQGSLPDVARAGRRVFGGGEGEGEGLELRSRSAGWAMRGEGMADGMRGSASDSILV